MAKMGMPVALAKQGYGKGKRGFSARALALEGLSERHSSDPDLDRSKTKDNIYMLSGFTSGQELADYWEQEAAAYRTVDKHGHEKRLRSDASIGCSLICKPEKAYMDTLTAEQQVKLVRDATNIVCRLCSKRGIQLDAGVIHLDEATPHSHIYGHDPKYQLGKKLNLAFFRQLNTKVPEEMRKLGWDIQDMTVYDPEATKDMTDKEKQAYKQQRRSEREEHGLSSLKYKQKRQKQRDKELDEREVTVSNREQAIDNGTYLQSKVAEVDAQKAALEVEKTAFELEKEKYQEKAKNAIQELTDAFTDKLGNIKNSHLTGKPHKVTVKDGKTVTVYEQWLTVSEAVQKAKQQAAALQTADEMFRQKSKDDEQYD